MSSENQDRAASELLKDAPREATIVGAPIEARNRTLIPVASAPGQPGWLERLKVRKPADAKPMGFLVLSDRQTRFVRVQDRRWLLLGICLAIVTLLLVIAGVSLKAQKSKPRKPALW